MKNYKMRIAIFFLGSYTLMLMYWMLLGFGRRIIHHQYMYNLKPFNTITHYLQFDKFNTNIWVINLLGNIAVFAPFGVLFPLIFGDRLRKLLVIFLCGIFVLESLQLLSRRGSFDVDDFILNTIGFLLGYGFYKIIKYSKDVKIKIKNEEQNKGEKLKENETKPNY